ncbi:MAG: OmpH family outer membrane protein [Desulfuromonas sp.]|nr:OmpH family outer membrane protein [Desulfuromonas sp.]
MKRIFITALVVFGLVTVANAAEVKVGFVDLQKAMATSAAGQSAKAKMDTEVQAVQDEVQKRQADLQALQESLKKQMALLSAEAKQEKDLDFQQQVRDYKSFVQGKQEQLRLKEKSLTEQILRDLGTQSAKLCKKEGVSVLLEKGQLVYAVDSIDYTDALIKMYDAEYTDSHK